MSVVGIVAEFNPFHSGHEYLLNQARIVAKNDPIIVLMSGNYVQRGQMAIMDKWSRAKAALNSGADLVFELPFSYAVQPADLFSRGSIEILSKLGVTDLFFGVEDTSLNLDYLAKKVSKIPQSSMNFRDYSQTYATQYNDMVSKEIGYEINQPNMILAIAYAVANISLEQPFKLHPVARIGGGHDDILVRENVVSSATSLRNHILNKKELNLLEPYIPKCELLDLQQQKVFPNWKILYKFLKYRLESASTKEIHDIYQMVEGLEFKMKEEIHNSQNFSEFLKYIKSKRYTYARLRRLSLYTLLNIHKNDISESLKKPSILLLGYNKRGTSYLKKIRKDATVPIISRVDKKNSASGTLNLQTKADRLFEQVYGKKQNFAHKPIEVK